MPATHLCNNNLICRAPAVCKSVLIKYGQFNRALVHSFGSTEVPDPQGSCLFKVDDVSIPFIPQSSASIQRAPCKYTWALCDTLFHIIPPPLAYVTWSPGASSLVARVNLQQQPRYNV